MKALQKFSKEGLERSRAVPLEEVVEFLDDFGRLHSTTTPQPSTSICIRVPKELLRTFQIKAKIQGMR